ncbi:hypothetical protein GCM10010121_080290 [Streptomyces brasiliensis]|uniref:Uncharacterized protein n=1 Tax=Streptomyces brasiliensis TaxID=1954 RepID=A0A917LCA4_9ACTN|nr:hypothetical protein GCM10010121_080290 [Streptomyces brasiliensis]
MAEDGELVGAETSLAALLPQPTVETHDTPPETGGFGETIHAPELYVNTYYLSHKIPIISAQ